MIFPLVEPSLPGEILRAWQRKSDVSAESRTRLESLMQFLEAEVKNEERIQMAKNVFTTGQPHKQSELTVYTTGRKQKEPAKANNVATAAGLLAVKEEQKPSSCIFYQESHESANCYKAKEMAYESRLAELKEKRVCFSCLKPKHTSQWCYSKVKCPWCGGKHVLLMCKKVLQNKVPTDKQSVPEKKVENLTLTCSNASSESDVCLQTLRVRIRDPCGERIVRALIDPGSHKSYVVGSLAQALHLEAVGQQTMVHLLFGGVKMTPRNHQTYKVFVSSIDGKYECCTTMFDEETICRNLPSVSLGSWQQVLRDSDVSLSDAWKDNKPISILIGADIAGRLYTGKFIQLKNADCHRD